jgi:cell division cycle 14
LTGLESAADESSRARHQSQIDKPLAMAPPSRHSQNLGQIIEYIPDRLYLAAYVHPPTNDTLFPYPESPVTSRKRSQRTVDAATNRPPPCYFSVDDTLLYNAFHHDFGPLHIGHLYRFAIQFHDILGAKENKDRPIVFWSAADPRSKAKPNLKPSLKAQC